MTAIAWLAIALTAAHVLCRTLDRWLRIDLTGRWTS